MDAVVAITSGGIIGAGEGAARLWVELPVRVDLAAAAAQCAAAWARARALVVVPLVRLLVFFSLSMTVMILVEKLFVCAVCLVVKAFRLHPQRRYRWEPIAAAAAGDDLEAGGGAAHPMVLVQIPMYNEREVYKLSIAAACALEWPSDRFVIQVLDDSTDPVVKDLVEMECQRWKSKGANIKYEVRGNRKGYKAGALKEGLKHDYVKDCEYIAMFDADFQPESDFLLRTVPFLVHNPEIALVQTRWKFVNADECLLTRFQEMSLDYHFKFEQEAGSSVYSFFGFNGTAGVWRISAIDDAGGWKDRTTVEDMDLAVRATLQGWKFVYVGDIKVKSELPSTFKAYRFQQHRWSCGPANLFKKMMVEILQNKKVSLWNKIHLWYDFFFVGKVAAHTVTFIYYCFAIPVSVLLPEIQIPLWGVIYVPTVITLLKALGTPSSFHLVILWVLFENVMSLHRIKAAVIGLLDAGGRVNEWVVTKKLGDANKTKPSTNGSDAVKVIDVKLTEPLVPKLMKRRTRFWERYHCSELFVGTCIILCGCYDVLYSKKGYYIYLFIQGMAFLVVGFGYVGTLPPRTE
ncbi:probable glucomannan 4-beta-mannosyltransferase 11 isoform X1 [Phragmites australis]|uniref:probable glucomannan 4-beta-mannosyltransferase 11 isoform X1 n=2 Tax=Phragmites australis TaxID=29695 RepID=UPI002D7670EC|nr:probable glucomannan 4-beta-mannosyltransferase 11 isoform X1 [Phragmites australis]